jgi:hypothetical protein
MDASMNKRPALLLTCLLLASTLSAAPARHGCGTDGSTPERIAALDATARARDSVDRRIAANGDSSGVRRSGDVVLVEADELNAPFFHPFDLDGREVRFARTSASTYASQTDAGTIDADFGAPLAIPQATHHAPYTLPFALPFFDGSVTQLHVTDYNALFLAAPQFPQAQQLGDLEAFASRQGVIAPMLTTDSVQFFEYPQVFVKTLDDAVRFTWRRDGGWQYTVQATLHRDGTIVFAYDAPLAPYACAMMLTSGAEPVRDVVETIVVSGDPAGDAPLPMLDLVTASLSRIADSNVLRFRFELGAAFAAGEAVAYTVWLDGVRGPALTFAADGSSLYSVPSWGITRGNPAARFDGSALELDVLQEQLPVTRVKPRVRVVTSRNGVDADEVSFDAALHKPKIAVAELDGPVIRTFTLPVVSVPQVWRQVQRAMHFDDAEFDAVAIYQNFWTDILFFANAYSSVGNAGVDGISRRTDIGSALPRTPALMHMNALQYTQGGGPPMEARQMLLHELGHRWLYFFDIIEDGLRSKVLAPLAGHPAQYVHTPAAFSLAGTTDSSAMGGGYFTDNRNGTFTSAKTRNNFGYSWHELYLMGFAAPEEVTPWFYIANSVPRLGPEYYPFPNRTYRGTRRDVHIDQVLDAMGPRFPAYPDTQRELRVLYVLLTDPSRDVTAEELAYVGGLQDDLERDFATVTGGRASVVTSIEGPQRRRRSVMSEQ